MRCKTLPVTPGIVAEISHKCPYCISSVLFLLSKGRRSHVDVYSEHYQPVVAEAAKALLSSCLGHC